MGFKVLNVADYRAIGAHSQPSIVITKAGLLRFSKAFFEKYGMLEHGKDHTKDKLAMQMVFDETKLIVGLVFIKNPRPGNGYFNLYRSGANMPNCTNFAGFLNKLLDRGPGKEIGTDPKKEKLKKTYNFEWKDNVVIEEIKATNAFTFSLSALLAQEKG